MKLQNDKISLRQLQMLLIIDIFGAGVIALPRLAAQAAAQDGWAAVAVAAVLSMVCTWLVMTVGRMFPGEPFMTYCGKLVTKPVAFLLSVCFVAGIIVNIAMQIRFFAEIVRQTMLYRTPPQIVMACILAVAGYAAAKGYEARARLAEVLLPVVLIPLAVVLTLAAFDVDYTNLLPVLKTSPNHIAAGGYRMCASFIGIEFGLLAYPYLNNSRDARGSAVLAVGMTGVMMVAVTVITTAKFGPDGLTKQMWPVLEMMDMVDFPGSFVERQDALLLSFWIVSVFAAVNAGLFFASLLAKEAVKVGQRSAYIAVCAAAAFIIACLPRGIEEVYAVMDVMFVVYGTAFVAAVPLMLIIVAKMRGLGGKV